MISQKLFQRSFYTTTARALQFQARSQSFGSPLAAASILPLRRTVATSVGSRPASQNLKHAALNIREEVGNSAADAARSIAGGNMATDYVPPDKQSSFVSLYTRLHLSEQRVTYTNFVAWCHQNSRRRRSHTLPHFRTCRITPLSWNVRHRNLPRQPSQSRSPRSSL